MRGQAQGQRCSPTPRSQQVGAMTNTSRLETERRRERPGQTQETMKRAAIRATRPTCRLTSLILLQPFPLCATSRPPSHNTPGNLFGANKARPSPTPLAPHVRLVQTPYLPIHRLLEPDRCRGTRITSSPRSDEPPPLLPRFGPESVVRA